MTGGVLRRSAGPPRKISMPHLKIIAVLAARPGKAEALRVLLDGMIAPSRAEPGNLRYDLWQDRTDPTRFVLDELYADEEAVASHRASPYFKTYLSQIEDLAERMPLTLDPVVVA
jgi:quinol monooxygenase YgiN